MKSKQQEYKHSWYEKNKERLAQEAKARYALKKVELIEKQKKYYEKNKEKIKQYKKEHYSLNRKAINVKTKAYYAHNKDKQSKLQKEDYLTDKPKYQERAKKYYAANREKIKAKSKKYAQENKGKINVRLREYFKKKRKTNSNFRLQRNMTTAVYASLKGNKQKRSWEELVGYSLIELKQHLESKFLDGMTWSNCGDWHLDHIKPICAFDITSYACDDFKACWSLSNLRPIWAIDNLRKSALDRKMTIKKKCYDE